MIRALVVDDEPLSRARLVRLLAAEADVEIVGECGDGVSAIATLAEADIDLVVLDIEMPEADGFAVIATIDGPAVIFVTAHEQYARRAFDADAVDYVVKPVDAERIAESLARVRRRFKHPTMIPARLGRRVRLVPADAIEWIEAQGNYAALHTGDRVELVRETMASLARRLDPARFVRIHRRIIVRVDRIRDLALHPTGCYTVRLHDGTELLSGRTYRAQLRSLVQL